MSSEKSIIIDAQSGTQGASLQISQFSDNFDTIRFSMDKRFGEYVLMIVAQIEGVPVVIETDSQKLYTEHNESDGSFMLVWHIGREITASSGLVVYQIVAYKLNGSDIESTWYSKEGRILVCDSIDTNSYSAELIGSYPNLITRLILETDIIRNMADSLESSKVDKLDGYTLTKNDFTDEYKSKLDSIDTGAEVNVIEKVKLDGAEIEINSNDKSVDIDMSDIRREFSESCDMLHNEYADLLILKNDVVSGKVLTSNDFTDEEKKKLDSIESGAKNNIFSFTADIKYVRGEYEITNPSRSFDYVLGQIKKGKSVCLTTPSGNMIFWATDFEDDIILFDRVCEFTVQSIHFYNSGNMKCTTNGIATLSSVREMISPTSKTEVTNELISNSSYNFGVLTEPVLLEFPSEASDGDVIYLTFMSSDTPAEFSINTSNTNDIEFIPEADTGYEIFAKYNGSIWIVNYSEYTVS